MWSFQITHFPLCAHKLHRVCLQRQLTSALLTGMSLYIHAEGIKAMRGREGGLLKAPSGFPQRPMGLFIWGGMWCVELGFLIFSYQAQVTNLLLDSGWHRVWPAVWFLLVPLSLTVLQSVDFLTRMGSLWALKQKSKENRNLKTTLHHQVFFDDHVMSLFLKYSYQCDWVLEK